jgi:hypothetical protein
MKWIVVKLSGDAARPASKTGDDTITTGDRVRAPRQRHIFVKDDETGTAIVLSRPVKGVCKRVTVPAEQVKAKFRHQFSFLSN